MGAEQLFLPKPVRSSKIVCSNGLCVTAGVSTKACPMERLVTNPGFEWEVPVKSARKWAAASIAAFFLTAGLNAMVLAPCAWALQPEESGPRPKRERASGAVSRAVVGQTAFVPAKR